MHVATLELLKSELVFDESEDLKHMRGRESRRASCTKSFGMTLRSKTRSKNVSGGRAQVARTIPPSKIRRNDQILYHVGLVSSYLKIASRSLAQQHRQPILQPMMSIQQVT